jgi:hypothetical protein
MGIVLHPHHRTSYPLLALLLLLTGFAMVAISGGTSASTAISSVTIGGVMPGPPPSSAPSISPSISDGRHFTSTPITISGSCISGLRVVVERNGQVAGQAYCTASGSYSLLIDLVPGRNELVVRQYDSADQASPPSAIRVVYYDILSAPIAIPVASGGKPPTIQPSAPSVAVPPLLLTSTFNSHAIFPDTEFSFPFEIKGGVTPYAVQIDWGDGSSSLLSIANPGNSSTLHSYTGPGKYKIVIKATDAKGTEAYFQTALTVNGKTVAPPATATPEQGFVILWPIFIVVATLVLGFWLGDRYEKGRLRRRAELPIMQ